jgi:hypothetical protein
MSKVWKGFWSRILNIFFNASKALSMVALRFECLRLKNSLACRGRCFAENSLRWYLVFLKGGRIPDRHAYPASPR